MGHPQSTDSQSFSARASRFPPRRCHRKGCEAVFVPRCWNQRYCRQPACLRELHRWQAAKRQQRRRNRAEVRRQHAEAERQRRSRQRATRRAAPAAVSSSSSVSNAPATSRAWSRSKQPPENFCDRPGCFEAVRPSCRAPSRYCGDTCREAVRRVRDRERKWKRRHRHLPGVSRRHEASGSPHPRRHAAQSRTRGHALDSTSTGSNPVRDYRSGGDNGLSSGETHQEVFEHDQETCIGRRPRASPSP